ncbi:uncharacterized protein LOC111021831 [Momordica charantia]|uniref:Uncharacterized protein LOC111021831 n=1 Tax=Momordica charantia TaxID=3673 RepID=A0A6J1DKR8_MOMCH|nr:uncharacterized protein LOC111021831 [Momordica charantia]
MPTTPPSSPVRPIDPIAPVLDDSSSPNSSSSVSGVDSVLNPYYLHHTDNTELVLVTQPLTEENYSSWSRSMLIALSIKNKLGFIDGSISRPIGELLPAWIHNNHVVIAWILNSVSKEISSSILFSESARDIWIDLKERFEKSNGPRIFQLKRDLAQLWQNQQSVSLYFTKLKAVWDELIQYRPLCSCSCVSSSPSPTASLALAVQHSAHSSKTMTKSLATTSKGKKERPFCTHCGLFGHTIDRCYKLHGYPPGYRSQNLRSSSQAFAHSASSQTTSGFFSFFSCYVES